MKPRRVDIFFYGSFINLDVLKQNDLVPETYQTASLADWDIRIQPLATLVPEPGSVVYGIVAACTHEELDRLYGQDWVRDYVPEPVIVSLEDRSAVPALTYIKWHVPNDAGAPDPDYVERIARPAKRLGFPEAYIAHLRSFARPR